MGSSGCLKAFLCAKVLSFQGANPILTMGTLSKLIRNKVGRGEPFMSKRKTEITIHSSAAEYLTYVASVGDSNDSFEMRYEDENIWLTQKMLATLYDVDVRTINEHIKKNLCG